MIIDALPKPMRQKVRTIYIFIEEARHAHKKIAP